VLVRKASTIQPAGMVGNWLYGVAYRTALNARTLNARRRAKENEMKNLPRDEGDEPDSSDLRPLLDHELERLPDKYRASIVLCDLEGKSREEAARQLGLPEGTLSSRLARAREMLGQRLTRRCVALSVGAVAATLMEQAAPAAVPSTLLTSTIQTGARVAGGQALAAAAPASVAVLTEGVLRTMFVTRLKVAAALLVTLGILGTGAAVIAHQSLRSQALATAGKAASGPAALAEPAAEGEKDLKKEIGEKLVPAVSISEEVGNVERVAGDGKSFWLFVKGQVLSDKKKIGLKAGEAFEVKIADETQVIFNDVGPDGARPTVGQAVHVWWKDESSKSGIPSRIVFSGAIKKVPDVVGRVVAVQKDGNFTVEVTDKTSGEKGKRIDISCGPDTRIIYNGVGMNGARPTVGYLATVWLRKPPDGNKDGDAAFARIGNATEMRFDGPASEKAVKPAPDKPKGDKAKPDAQNPDKPKGEKPGSEKPKPDGSKSDKPKSDKPSGDNPKGEKPGSDKPKGEKPSGDKPKSEGSKPDNPKQAPADKGKPKPVDKEKGKPAPGDGDKPANEKKPQEPESTEQAVAPRAFAPVVAAIDREIDRRLREARVPASARADDAEFLRRVTLDIVGRIPTLTEARAFL
jgi:RNA polymerase sigma factor (sigma-70 family)